MKPLRLPLILLSSALSLTSLALASSAIFLDEPYTEIVGDRRPTAGLWPSGSLPTNWTESPPALQLFAASVTNGSSSLQPKALLLGEDGGVYDAESLQKLRVSFGSVVPTASWVFLASSPSAAPQSPTIYAVDRVNIYAGHCDLQVGCYFTTAGQHGLSGVAQWTAGLVFDEGLACGNATEVGSVQRLLVSGMSSNNTSSGNGSSAAGTAIFSYSQQSGLSLLLSAPGISFTAAAFSAERMELAVGNATKLALLDSCSLLLQRWDWVTNIPQGWGGPIDDFITALSYSPDGSLLFIANPTALNFRQCPPGTASGAARSQLCSYYRLSGDSGLPMANLTSLAVDDRQGGNDDHLRLWIGSLQGVALLDVTELLNGTSAGSVASMPGGQAALLSGGGARTRRGGMKGGRGKRVRGAANASPAMPGSSAPTSLPTPQIWRYFFGPRYLATPPAQYFACSVGSSTYQTAAFSNSSLLPFFPTPLLSIGNSTYILTLQGGLSILRAQSWTLAAKAALLQSLLPRHDWAGGLVSECNFNSFGQLDPCADGPSANSGLWSSLVVGALSMQYAVTGDAGIASEAAYRYQAMVNLHTVTGVTGLIARSLSPPGSAVNGSTAGWHWSNSSSFPGYSWYGDASSDEVTGHVFAAPLYADLVVAGGGGLTSAASPLLSMVSYILANNFSLIDITGLPTTWGHWSPALLNAEPNWSDVRGTNSMQMLSQIIASWPYAQAEGNATLAQQLQQAYTYLTSVGQSSISGGDLAPTLFPDYLGNLQFVRMTAPVDVNFSDDELIYFAYYSLIAGAARHAAAAQQAGFGPAVQAALQGLQAGWSAAVAEERSSMWGLMYLNMTGQLGGANPFSSGSGGGSGSGPSFQDTAADILWNLRTWPLDMVDWPTQNSARADVSFDRDMDRFGQIQLQQVLPVNERSQTRWNSNPFQADDGSGHSECDPGAFLLPYWMARWTGFLSG